MYTHRRDNACVTLVIYKGDFFLCPHFKIPILPFKYNNLLNFIKLAISAFSLILFIYGYSFICSDIFHFIFNKYNFTLYINLIILQYYHLLNIISHIFKKCIHTSTIVYLNDYYYY